MGYRDPTIARFHMFVPPSDGCCLKNGTPAAAKDLRRQISISPTLSLSPFKHNIQYSFLFAHLIWSQHGSPWLQAAAQGKLGDLALEACHAFSMKLFGHHHSLIEVENRGAEVYGGVVLKLSNQLPSVRASSGEQLLAPAMILLLQAVISILLYRIYEANCIKCIEDDSQATGFHLKALCKLLKLCGPKPFTAEPLRGVFESCRATLVRTLDVLQRERANQSDLDKCCHSHQKPDFP
jgi:hypothetical protein